MEQYIIKGGNPLVGEVVIGGAKNAALPVLAAAVMTDGKCMIDNMPDVRDINVLLQAMQEIGADVDRTGKHEVTISGKGIHPECDVDNEFIRKIRASYYLIGALLGKYKRARVALPGGCEIGSRPIDQHIKGFKMLGAQIEIENGMISATAEELKGAHIYMDVVSVGATINVMMAASLAKGNTIIENAAKEPHVVDVANFLNSMGAKIRGAGTDVIRIKGVEKFGDCQYSIIPDQIEAGTFMTAAVATKGDIMIKNVIPKHLDCLSSKLREIGCEVSEFDDAVRVVCKERLHATSVNTMPYPGFPTDMQPQMSVVLALARGTSVVTESIFDNRFRYVDELIRMGASIQVESNIAIINGIEQFSGTSVTVPDLRAGAALVIAGLAAQGVSVLEDIVYIKRGYEDFAEKLTSLGGIIEEVETEKDIQRFRLKNGTTNW
jgi:UDP-N-acetylglucosamine 1-carboxyvinyltransferase